MASPGQPSYRFLAVCLVLLDCESKLTWSATLTFYVQTWDEYYTQVLTLGVISGPIEGVLTLCTVFAFTAYEGGGSFWHRSMFEVIGIAKSESIPEWVYEMPFTQWYLIYGAIILFFATGSSIAHVMKVQVERGHDPIKPLYGLLPVFAMWTLVPAYLYLQPTILENYLIPFTLYVGLINAYSVGRMIVGHLIKGPFPYFNILMFPLAIGVFDSLGPVFGLWPSALGGDVRPIAFVFICLGLAVGVYGSFVVCIPHLISRKTLTRTARRYHHDMRLHRHLVLDHQASAGCGATSLEEGCLKNTTLQAYQLCLPHHRDRN